MSMSIQRKKMKHLIFSEPVDLVENHILNRSVFIPYILPRRKGINFFLIPCKYKTEKCANFNRNYFEN